MSRRRNRGDKEPSEIAVLPMRRVIPRPTGYLATNSFRGRIYSAPHPYSHTVPPMRDTEYRSSGLVRWTGKCDYWVSIFLLAATVRYRTY